MFYNYLKITLRNLRKHPAYTFINISGLALGIASCLLIMLFVTYELSYEAWNKQAERTFRPITEIKFGGNHESYAVIGSPIGPDLQRDFPEVQANCRFRVYGAFLVKRDGEAQQNIREEHVLYADSSLFEVFPLQLLEGDARSCLTQPNNLVISKSRAEKYFGSPQLAIGRTLILDNEERWQVSGVFADIPANTHFKSNFFLAMNGNREVQNDSPLWATSNNFQTYLLLRPGVDPAVFEAKFQAYAKKKINETAQKVFGQDISALESTGQYVRYFLQPLPSIHLHSDMVAELQPNGSIQHVWIFSAIALFILLIACINFMNLTTARSAHRAREIGVRKVLGSPRLALIQQFLGESFILTGIAFVLAVLIATLIMPWFADLTNRPIHLPWSNPIFWMGLVVGTGLVGLLAGLYPAFFLSAFEPIRTLKGDSGQQAGSSRLRSSLVVFQFATAIALIISTGFVYKQLNFIQQKKLGFQKEQVLTLQDAYALDDAVQVFKNKVLKIPSVESATLSSYLPVPSSRSDQIFSKIRGFREDQSVNMQYWRVDKDYIKTLGLEILEGRFFDPEKFPTDSAAIVLNETAAKRFGFTTPIGSIVYSPEGEAGGRSRPEDFAPLHVIGIVKDFHFASLRENIGALSMRLGRSNGFMSIRYNAENTEQLIATLEDQWKATAQGQPFQYEFMDDSFAQMYATEQRIGTIAGIFALLAVLISCLGLFGLAAFTAERRTKEIGIRRVLGATATGIVGLLSKDFLKLVMIALILAIPLAWYFMNNWLENFAYRTEIQWWVFALAGLTALVVAFLTISFQSIKAALANPIKSLRSE